MMTAPLDAPVRLPPSANDHLPVGARLRCFGPFVLDAERLRLTREGAPVAASAQPLEILVLFLDRPGRVLTRAELKRALWPGCERIDTGRRLNTAMRALREALGDTAGRPRFIETIRGRGYRWVFEEPATTPRRAGRRRLGLVLLAPISLAAGLLAADQGPVRSAPPVSDLARRQFLYIASTAQTEPGAALARLDRLANGNPGYREAQILRARMSVQRWRDAPSPHSLRRAESALGAAGAAVGASAELEALNAEVAFGGRWDRAKAEGRYRRALVLEPENLTARKGLAWLLVNAGRDAEALRALEPMLARADLSDDQRAELGWLLLRAGRSDLAGALCQARASRHFNLLSCRHTALARQGRHAGARRAGVELMTVMQAPAATVQRVRASAPQAGYHAFLKWQAEQLSDRPMPWFQRAQLLAAAGRSEEALASLERAYRAREPALLKLGATGEFDALRDTPRFRAIAEAMRSVWSRA